MTYNTHTGSILFLITLVFAPALVAQDRVKSDSARISKRESETKSVNREHEKMIRSLYEKLVVFNAAAETQQSEQDHRSIDTSRILKFELGNFHSGSIQEIIDKPYLELITPPTGQILALTRGRYSLNGGPEEVVFEASWQKGRYASVSDPGWTFRDMLQAMAEKYFDIGSYTSYEVTVLLDGKLRTYRAMAAFHDLLGTTTSTPEFWDLIVPNLHQVWSENRLPYKPKSPDAVEQDPDQGLPGDADVSSASYLRLDRSSSGYLDQPSASTAPIHYFWFDLGNEGHASGSHYATANFDSFCTSATPNTQRCDVKISNFVGHDSGTLDSYTLYHQEALDKRTEGAVGAKGTNVTCQSAAGVTFSSCVYLMSCNATATLGISSGVIVSATISGGNLWRSAHAERATCSIPKGAGGGGVCAESRWQSAKSTVKQPAPRLTDPSCCRAEEQIDCINGGGEWNNFTCTCLSPIVIDLAGNGFDLTNAANGVLFDLARTGVPEQVSWTAANSDDAWLVLDRNGNGIIDDGKELFGSATPQPYLAQGESKNGFRALAVFDKPESGGNDDGRIDTGDRVFSSLKLWQDSNHNGVSEGSELQSLADSPVRVIELAYKESRRTDDQGNWFRYRAKVSDGQGNQMGRWAWDVFLQKTH